MKMTVRHGLILMMALVITACATGPSPYQRATGQSGFGYREQSLETDRFRVTYRGDSLTDRETVENYLLYRSAELTVERGGDYFIVERQQTEREERVYSTATVPRYPGFYYSVYGGYWHRNRLYHMDTYRLVERYEASAVIKIYSGEVPRNDVSAYDARDVLRTLETLVLRPGEPSAGS